MTQEQKNEKIQEVFADKEFVEKLLAMDTPEEVQAAVKEKGLELTLEEIEATKKSIVNSLEKNDSDEVSDDQLEQVAGGFAITTALVIAGAITAGATGAAALGSAVHRWTGGRW
jgi:predicted ribosomally synthesized peptide with nif11-like leader